MKKSCASDERSDKWRTQHNSPKTASIKNIKLIAPIRGKERDYVALPQRLISDRNGECLKKKHHPIPTNSILPLGKKQDQV